MNAGDRGPHVLYEFGDFRLDAGRRLLYAKGEPTPRAIKPRVLDALLLFVRHPGELQEKDRLLAELWPGRIVEEGSLNQVVSSLRRVLQETPGEHRYIATVPGRGYTFVAQVLESPQESERRVSPQPIRWSRTTMLISLGLVVCGALLAYGWYARVWLASEATPAAIVTPPGEVSSKTIAVLPFANLSADEENEYIASGLAESILHRLANVDGLTLIARTSSFVFRDQSADVRDIGRALNAGYLVEGSLQRSGERLRVTAQLIDATSGGHLWSLRFERAIDDIFAVEDEIAQTVARALDVSLDSEQHPYARFGTDAYLAYLNGRELVATGKIADAERAIGEFSQAIDHAPEFAAAYAALAEAHRHLAYVKVQGPSPIPWQWSPGDHGALLAAAAQTAEPLLARALQLDDSLGEAYVLRADLKAFADDPDGSAEADYRKGLALSPSYGIGHEHFAQFLALQGRDDEAHAELDKGIVVDPLSPGNYYRKAFMSDHFSEETEVLGEQAAGYLVKALAVAPEYYPALLRLGILRWYQGRFAEAVRLGEQALAIEPRSNALRSYLLEFYLELGEVDAARSVLAEQPDPAQPHQWLALCLYERKADRAAELLAAGTDRGFRDKDVEAYVMRDAAMANGRLEEARQGLVLSERIYAHLFAAVARAQLSLALGDNDEAQTLAQAVAADEECKAYVMAYPCAGALTLLGQHEAALDLLGEGSARGYRKRWWYALERDPAFEMLRSDPRFQALGAQARAHAAAERDTLERMRARGQVPIRQATGDGVC